MGLVNRLQHAWNAFVGKGNSSKKDEYYYDNINKFINYGYGTTIRPDRIVLNKGTERSIITSVFNRIALDVSSIKIRHVRLDNQNRYVSDVDSYLNDCLSVEANKDQTARAFIQDIVMSMMDEGVIAVVPIDTDHNPENGSYDIESLRVGKITQWYPDYVEVEVYNDRTGKHVTKVWPKKEVAIIENPLYAVVNAPNSTLQRLIRKLNILDAIDEQSGSGKLDLIIQLPYIIKTETRKQQAENRKQDIENQLSNSKYGIAYTDGTEKITQLNRPIENNVMKSVEYLTSMLYSQLGITAEIMNGTADEEAMVNYMSRSIEPIIASIVDEFARKFLTKTARTQKQTIMFFNDPFKLIPLTKLADFADKFTRNEILSSNELRQIIGMKPSNDPKADELRNKNISSSDGQTFANTNNTVDNNGEVDNSGNQNDLINIPEVKVKK